MAKTGFSDLFDFSDNKEIQKAIDALRALNAEHSALLANVEKGRAKFAGSIKKEGEAVDKLTKELKGLDTQREENQQTITKTAKIVDASAKKVEELAKAQKGAKQISDTFGKSVDALNARLRAQTKEFNLLKDPTRKNADEAKRLGKEIQKTKAEIKDITAITRTQNNAFERAEGSYNALTKRTNELRAQLKNLPGAFDKSAKGTARFKKRSQELTKEIANNNTKLKAFDKTLGDNFRNVGNYRSAVAGAAGELKRFALQLTAATLGLQALLQAGREGFNTFVDFEFTMAQVQAVSGATADEFERLDALAKDLGSTTASTASDIASLELELSKLGFTTDQIIDATPAINALSIAMGEDLGETAKTVASTINAFGLEASDAAMIANQFASIASKSAISLNEMGTIIGTVGKVSDTAGISLNTTLALVGKLKDNAQDASTASTSLRNILLELSSSSSKLSKAVGFTVQSEEDLFKALDILGKKGIDLNEIMGESTEEVGKLGEAAELTGKRTVTSLTILQDLGSEVQALSTDVLESTDALDKFTEIMSGTTQVALKETTSAMQGFAITLFDALKPAITAVLAVVISLFSALQAGIKLVQENKDVFIALGVAIAGFKIQATLAALAQLKLTLAQKASVFSIANARKAWAALNAIMAANPIGIVIAALAGLFIALKKLEVFTSRYAEVQETTNMILEDAAEQADILTEVNDNLATATAQVADMTDQQFEATVRANKAILSHAIALLEDQRAQQKLLTTQAAELTMLQKLTAAAAGAVNPALAAANAAQSSAKNIVEATKSVNAEIENQLQLILDLQRGIDDLEKARDVSEKRQVERAKARTKREKSDANKLAIFRLEQQAKLLKAEMDAEDEASEFFIQSAEDLSATLIKIEQIRRDEALAQDNLTAEARTLIMEQFAAKSVEIAGGISSEVSDQILIDLERVQAALSDLKPPAGIELDDVGEGEEEGFLEEQARARELLLQRQQGQQIAAFRSLEELRTNDLISEKDYNDRLIEIQRETQQTTIDGLKAIFGSSREIQELETEMMRQENDKRETDAKETWKAIGAFALEAFNVATELASAQAEREVEDAEFRIERLEAERAKDVELAGNNQVLIDAINQKAEEDRIVLEERRKQALIKQAKIEKATALLGAIVNTAKAVAGALPIIPLAILVGALGAVQIATIASAPIPQFAKGTDSAPAGYAIVAEEGAEAIKSKDGKTEIVSKPSIKKLKGGEKIYTAKQTKSLAQDALNNQFNTIGTADDAYAQSHAAINGQRENRAFEKEVVKMIGEGNEKLSQSIKDMERFSFEGTTRGLRAYARKGANRNEILNNRYG